jgi:hypothetical protein
MRRRNGCEELSWLDDIVCYQEGMEAEKSMKKMIFESIKREKS